MNGPEEQVKQSKIWGSVLAIVAVALIAALGIGCTVSSLRSAQKDEAIKISAAENGCSYNNGVLTCPSK